MLAYACGPEATGEHWLGWGWAREASRLGEVHLITTPKYRESILTHAKGLGIQAHFLAARGSEGWGRKLRWQKDAFRLASGLHQQNPFVLAHQTTFHTFRVPCRCADLGIPSVWGPVAGGESVPPGFYSVLGKARWQERLRAIGNRLCLLQPSVRHSLRKATRIFVSNRTTLQFLPRRFHSKCRIIPPNAVPSDQTFGEVRLRTRAVGTPFRLLYVGNCVSTRAIPLVLAALREAGPVFHLTVVGGGPSLQEWKAQARALGVESRADFLGLQPKEKLPDFYQKADLFVFPALRDSGGSALLEAMIQGLPVLCFAWGGPAEMVAEETGFLAGLENPSHAVRDMGAIMRRLQENPEIGFQRACRAQSRALDHFSWGRKGEILTQTYREILLQP
jgi:glycosyltransferase involved in cell wall biosynthesis